MRRPLFVGHPRRCSSARSSTRRRRSIRSCRYRKPRTPPSDSPTPRPQTQHQTELHKPDLLWSILVQQEKGEGQKPIFSVRRSSIIGWTSGTVEVYDDPVEEYQVKGSFVHRCVSSSGSGYSIADRK
ncbi:hypothetical protein U1Q18_034012 [Sarracenia purpurea var. burkii]